MNATQSMASPCVVRRFRQNSLQRFVDAGRLQNTDVFIIGEAVGDCSLARLPLTQSGALCLWQQHRRPGLVPRWRRWT
jgi:hypothetical protein